MQASGTLHDLPMSSQLSMHSASAYGAPLRGSRAIEGILYWQYFGLHLNYIHKPLEPREGEQGKPGEAHDGLLGAIEPCWDLLGRLA